MAKERMLFGSKEEWLNHRTRIGGSDAAAIIGMNPYRTNQELWEIKIGLKQAKDISEKPYVKYGTEAEQHLRELFALDFPEYKVEYFGDNMWLNDKFPFAAASLDGELTDKQGRRGILEIKTTEIMRAGQKDLWNNRIPDNYYIQLLHYLMVTGFEFAVLKGQLKFNIDGDIFLQTKHYKIERSEVQADIDYLQKKETEFWEYVKSGKRPHLILPQI